MMSHPEAHKDEAGGRELELGQLAKKVHVADLRLNLGLVLKQRAFKMQG